MAYLDVTLNDSDFHRQYPLEGDDEIVVGRAPDCALRIAHRSLSRSHCKLVPFDDGWLLEDCDSTNGTQLNNSQLIGGRPLNEGDQISAGVARIVFHVHEMREHSNATTYQALDVPSAIKRRDDAVEHNALGLETDTQLPAPASDEILIDTDDSFIDIDDPDSGLWDEDDGKKDGTDSLWLE